MELTRCENGHYYNKEKFPSCPHCAHVPAFSMQSQDQSEVATALPNAGAISRINQSLRKTTGWLVCTSGNMIGESFSIREGKNLIGRSTSMDIVLLYENSVSRENHAYIEYNAASHSFMLATDHTENQISVNDEKLSEPVLLSDRDQISLGKCTLTFIPFCTDDFHW
ncbi:MAG: FHA domain-containing protein [Lachnospiraceae bacterium]|nr:FHA domain-containing protein [Lachnospiraceae bacterium]